jgi:hypothetical protein
MKWQGMQLTDEAACQLVQDHFVEQTQCMSLGYLMLIDERVDGWMYV